MRPIVWTRAAEADLQAIFQGLEDPSPGQGANFLELVDASLSLLSQFPEMAPVFLNPVRRLLLNDRMHGIFYVIEDRGIIVHAIVDLRRDPTDLRKRFKAIL